VKRWTGEEITEERAYAMSNAKEYFAESSEAYFGRNDFYPFTRAELKEHDPQMYDLLERLWQCRTEPAAPAGSL
jgi:Mlc titration factor MtfA (ptsG expression regulator)